MTSETHILVMSLDRIVFPLEITMTPMGLSFGVWKIDFSGEIMLHYLVE